MVPLRLTHPMGMNSEKKLDNITSVWKRKHMFSLQLGNWIFSEGGAWQETEGWCAFPNLFNKFDG